ncbi:hypothetical protein BU25DRAFT_454886 [Macroventuria anomochaeta]|uniref:Uncharacterized protein n=1 Tax=Macroventuria anomochaeta TaxID=301207 RepID=A0ACB6SDU9_9PLEO|nr:uncharacterized protein BU25DRAFT_454886 [Macroventuria anomochaeta]KAF2631434.1 hypothetical protein BU25DRAFT_454886 [Macroventuria anomochaeta]
MKNLTTLLAIASLTTLTAAAPSLVEGSCGKCDTFPGPQIGGNAQIPLRNSANKSDGKAYKCTTFGKEVRLSTCTNQICSLCMIFKDDDCQGDILQWGGPGSEFGGQGARSYFCI